MSVGRALRALFTKDRGATIRVHVLVKGRIGQGWQDVDRWFELPTGSALAALLDAAERAGVPLRDAIAKSPHLAQTIMLNGERCPVEQNLDKVLADGDQIYLLAPLAGG